MFKGTLIFYDWPCSKHSILLSFVKHNKKVILQVKIEVTVWHDIFFFFGEFSH